MDALKCIISKPKPNNNLKPIPGTSTALSDKFRQSGLAANYSGIRGNASKLVKLQFTSTGKNVFAVGRKFTFDYDNLLSTREIKGIEVIGTAQMTFAGTNPNTDIPQSELVKGYIVFVDHCDNEVSTMPLASLCKALNGNKVTFTNFPLLNWAACYVRFSDPSTSISAANSLVFNIYFKQ